MLFVDEAPFADTIRGSTSFAELRGRRSSRSARAIAPATRSQARCLKYPCSYMIYSAQFEALPQLAKDAIYRRMWQSSPVRTRARPTRHLAAADRAAIVDILRDTKRDLPGYFR